MVFVRQIFAFDRFAGFDKFAVLTPYKCAKFEARYGGFGSKRPILSQILQPAMPILSVCTV